MRVFISHTINDAYIADSIQKRLNDHGIEIWKHSYEITPGKDIIYEINKAIDESDVILYIITKNSIDNRFINTEISLGISKMYKDNKKIIIPLLFDAEAEIPLFLRNIKYIDFTSNDKLETSYIELIETIRDNKGKQGEYIDLIKSYADFINANKLELEAKKVEYEKRKILKDQRGMASLGFVSILASIATLYLVIENAGRQIIDYKSFFLGGITGVVGLSLVVLIFVIFVKEKKTKGDEK